MTVTFLKKLTPTTISHGMQYVSEVTTYKNVSNIQYIEDGALTRYRITYSEDDETKYANYPISDYIINIS